tara:strand:- start:480 stop:1094 length:615 start_codon:yes stop_codon:yes gene_type:complete
MKTEEKTPRITTADYLDFAFLHRRAEALIDNPKLKIIGIYIAVAMYTGLRYSDLIKLTWEHLHYGNAFFDITEQKTSKVRRITISKKLRDLLMMDTLKTSMQEREEWDKKKYDLIFLSQKGTPFTNQALNRILKIQLRECHIQKENISTHTLRKSFGRRIWEKNGKSEEGLIYLMDLFNHSSLKITKTYLGITADDRAKLYLSL